MKNRLPCKIRWSLGICSVLIALSLIAASCSAAVTSTPTTTHYHPNFNADHHDYTDDYYDHNHNRPFHNSTAYNHY